MSLKEQLEKMSAEAVKNMPADVLATMQAANEKLRADGIGANALGVGDSLPYAELTSATGEKVNLSDYAAKGPMIITFYRGGWCPYCNLELKAYQDSLEEITALGGQLIAVTPEKPDNSLSTAEKNELVFPVLTDDGNALAEKLGILFELPAELQPIYGNFGINLPELNAESGWTLPIPATFVVNASGEIVLADVDVEYNRRLEPSDAVAALKDCAVPA